MIYAFGEMPHAFHIGKSAFKYTPKRIKLGNTAIPKNTPFKREKKIKKRIQNNNTVRKSNRLEIKI
jgi:hypothetical protein